ncbi:MAG: formate/nitrite transporter family protein [Christensenellales bacterium]
MTFFLNSLGAGIAVALGGYAYLACESRYLGGFLFSFGLLIVCEYGLTLYTGRCGYCGRKGGLRAPQLLLMLLANFLGAALVGLIWQPVAGGQEVVGLVSHKLTQGLPEAFLRALLCGVVVHLSVDVYKRSAEPLGRYLGILLGVPLFIIARFEHCVADIFYLAAALSQGFLPPWGALPFLAAVILGNTAGALLINAILPPRAQKGV